MSLRGIHHVGVAVADLDEAIATYERLFGAIVEHRGLIEGQGALKILNGQLAVDQLFEDADPRGIGQDAEEFALQRLQPG